MWPPKNNKMAPDINKMAPIQDVAPKINKMAPKWPVLPKMNGAPQNEQCSPKRTEASLLYHWLPKTNSTPQNDMNVWRKKLKKMAVFATETWTKLAKKNLWLGICVEKGFWAKKSAQLVIPVCSTFQNDSHPPIEGHHPLLYFTTQIKKKYCTAMCYNDLSSGRSDIFVFVLS